VSSPVLLARELRWQTRLALSRGLGSDLMSVTLRAPQALRRDVAFGHAFERLCQRMELFFASQDKVLGLILSTQDAEGPARHYRVLGADRAKALALRFEDEAPGGALLDIDVMDTQGQTLSRGNLDLPPRACAVCGARPAAQCIRDGRHCTEETQAAFHGILAQVNLQKHAPLIGRLALKALLYEVSVTPKPGLVDRLRAGAHNDMDYYSFLDSALALGPYFEACAAIGEDGNTFVEELLQNLRPLGIRAEQSMMEATGGANTHKGLIFSLGILCAAAGRLGTRAADSRVLCALAGSIASPSLKDTASDTPSHGQTVMARHGDLGARGEAASGFPSVLTLALPAMRRAMKAGEGPDRAGIIALLQLMASLRDTNVLHRAGEEGLTYMRQEAKRLLGLGAPMEALLGFAGQMEARHLSPGGCADLLALAFFLYLLEAALAPSLP
jgi:holo-ACP synthase/triphosphoribosyl-dephospho-CoA synthase